MYVFYSFTSLRFGFWVHFEFKFLLEIEFELLLVIEHVSGFKIKQVFYRKVSSKSKIINGGTVLKLSINNLKINIYLCLANTNVLVQKLPNLIGNYLLN